MKKLFLLPIVLLLSACGSKDSVEDPIKGAPSKEVKASSNQESQGTKIDGTYKNDHTGESLAFKPDGFMTEIWDGTVSTKLRYKINGDQIEVDGTTSARNLTIKKDGSIEGPGSRGVFIKQ